jgi:hypothetical protein
MLSDLSHKRTSATILYSRFSEIFFQNFFGTPTLLDCLWGREKNRSLLEIVGAC